MNKRIKQLAEQVDSEFNSPYDRHKAIERFAELIVRECAEIACSNTRVDSKLYLMIQEHFGVEP